MSLSLSYETPVRTVNALSFHALSTHSADSVSPVSALAAGIHSKTVSLSPPQSAQVLGVLCV